MFDSDAVKAVSSYIKKLKEKKNTSFNT